MASRRIIQWLAALGCNANIPGFFKGRIYRGELKSFCVPGLNCYSCPGAIASCPLGAVQAVIGSARYAFSFYAVGLMIGFGLIFGRLICGFLCPFGLLQELLHKIRFLGAEQRERISAAKYVPPAKSGKIAKQARLVKYAILAVFVFALPLLTKGEMEVGDPAFCKYICPAGTITAGGPLLAANPPMRENLGWLFALKTSIALITVIGCLASYRFFCKFLCPLGTFYGLFNSFALYRLRLEKDVCVNCGACASACGMGVDPARAPDSPECIRCGDCVKTCPVSALSAGFRSARHQSQGVNDVTPASPKLP
jgi:polyferredoxin